MKRISIAAISTSIVGLTMAAFALTPLASADGQGQIDGGAPFYQVANLTQNTAYGSSTSAKACDELEYSVKLHNSGYSSVTSVVVKATLPTTSSTSNTSTATATYKDGIVPSTSGSVTVNLSSAQSISLESNSAKLYKNGQVIQNLSDDVIGNGVNIGTIPGSTTEFVNFKAKVSCPTPPPTPTYACTELGLTAEENRTVKISQLTTSATNGASFSSADIAWGDGKAVTGVQSPVGQSHQYGADGTFTITATANFKVGGKVVSATSVNCQKQVTFSTTTPPKVTPPTTPPATPPAPTALVNTGPGSVVALFGAATAAGTFAYRRMLSRRLSRQ